MSNLKPSSLKHSPKSLFLFLEDGGTDSLSLREGHQRFVCFADHKNVRDPSGEFVPGSVLYMDYIERSLVPFFVLDQAHSADVLSSGYHRQAAYLKLYKVLDLPRFDVQNHRVINLQPTSRAALSREKEDLDEGIGESDGSAVVGAHKGEALVPNLELFYLAQLIRRLLFSDPVGHESPFGVVEQPRSLPQGSSP